MGKAKGMILTDLAVYLFVGALLMTLSLNTFKMVYASYTNFIRSNDVKADFINVTERIKFDLLKDMDSIDIYNNAIRFYFRDFTGESYVMKDYTLRMDNGRLSYVVNGIRVVGMDLSGLVQSIEVSVHGDVMRIRFHYPLYSFERSFRIDLFPKKRLYHSILSDSGVLSIHGLCRS